jgi:hypothetical protein
VLLPDKLIQGSGDNSHKSQQGSSGGEDDAADSSAPVAVARGSDGMDGGFSDADVDLEDQAYRLRGGYTFTR